MIYANILKASKNSNPRSEFLSQLMRFIGSDTGASVISAFKDKDITRFRKAMNDVIDKLVIITEKSKVGLK